MSQINLPTTVLSSPTTYAFRDGEMVIATHNGRFHADDALAVGLLLQLPRYRNAVVLRTRDEELIAKADVVVDVGQTYDRATHRYDHHQHTFNEGYNEIFARTTKLSSSGLVYKFFGNEILKHMFQMTDEEILLVKDSIYEVFFFPIDAKDNGVSAYPADATPLYVDDSNLISRVYRLNPVNDEWDRPGFTEAQFTKAIALTLQDLVDYVSYVKKAHVFQRQAMHKAVASRFDFHASGRIIFVELGGLDLNFLYKLEEIFCIPEDQSILFVLYPSKGSAVRVRAVNKSRHTFETRLPLPACMRGKSEPEIAAILPGIKFVHNNGFLAEAENLQAAFELIAMTMRSDTVAGSVES